MVMVVSWLKNRCHDGCNGCNMTVNLYDMTGWKGVMYRCNVTGVTYKFGSLLRVMVCVTI